MKCDGEINWYTEHLEVLKQINESMIFAVIVSCLVLTRQKWIYIIQTNFDLIHT